MGAFDWVRKAILSTEAARGSPSAGSALAADLPVIVSDTQRLAEDAISRGDHYRDKRNWVEARAAYSDALSFEPSLQPIWIQLGHAAKESGDYITAESSYRRALELNPNDADGHLQLGHLLKLQGRLLSALECYGRAVELDSGLTDAKAEIVELRARVSAEKRSSEFDITSDIFSGARKFVPEGSLSLVFEVSDLMSYFRGARLPTGIQRVQMEVIKSVIESGTTDFTYSIVCFAAEAQFWIEIPAELFLGFCRHATSGGEVTAREWVMLLGDLDGILKSDRYFRFPEGSLLLDLGTSWWQRNYFLNLRLAKSMYGVRYVPFVHDLIPVMTPEYCSENLRRDFLTWVTGVLNHADFFMCNSQSTARDLGTVAQKLGHALPEIEVVTLNADFRRSLNGTEALEQADKAAHFLAAHDLKKNQYVLCVSTIEARKNHVAAFSVWLKLIKKHGIRNVPKLVCVGKDGWLNRAAYDALSSSEILAGHVVILHKVSDAALAMLYQNCRCTLYPSFYEGWGLPVTEALCYGKVPVVSDISSLPEAGGDFAEYFDIESEKELLEAIERLVYDDAYRTERENKIAAEFHARSWPDISEQIVSKLQSWGKDLAEVAPDTLPRQLGVWPVKAETGVLQFLGSGTASILWGGLKNGEVYRNGRSWWWTEHWGCWTKGVVPATVAFVLENVAGSKLVVYLGLKGVPGKEVACTIKCDGARTLDVNLSPNRDQVVAIELEPDPRSNRLIAITLTTDPGVNLETLTAGADKRVIGAGVSWFYACKKDDLLARVAMAEALSMGDFARLAPQPPAKLDFFMHT